MQGFYLVLNVGLVMRNFGLFCFIMIVYIAVAMSTNNFFIAMGAMLLSCYLIRGFIKPSSDGSWNNGELGNQLDENFTTYNFENNAVYNPTTGLRMMGDCAGGTDIGGHNWCE